MFPYLRLRIMWITYAITTIQHMPTDPIHQCLLSAVLHHMASQQQRYQWQCHHLLLKSELSDSYSSSDSSDSSNDSNDSSDTSSTSTHCHHPPPAVAAAHIQLHPLHHSAHQILTPMKLPLWSTVKPAYKPWDVHGASYIWFWLLKSCSLMRCQNAVFSVLSLNAWSLMTLSIFNMIFVLILILLTSLFP